MNFRGLRSFPELLLLSIKTLSNQAMYVRLTIVETSDFFYKKYLFEIYTDRKLSSGPVHLRENPLIIGEFKGSD